MCLCVCVFVQVPTCLCVYDRCVGFAGIDYVPMVTDYVPPVDKLTPRIRPTSHRSRPPTFSDSRPRSGSVAPRPLQLPEVVVVRLGVLEHRRRPLVVTVGNTWWMCVSYSVIWCLLLVCRLVLLTAMLVTLSPTLHLSLSRRSSLSLSRYPSLFLQLAFPLPLSSLSLFSLRSLTSLLPHSSPLSITFHFFHCSFLSS